MSPNYCTIAPGDRVANSSNPAFDATTFEVWSTLTAGGTLVVLPPVTELPLDSWVDLIRAERITTMFLTTSLFHMVAQGTANSVPHRRHLDRRRRTAGAGRSSPGARARTATAAGQRLRPDRDHDIRHLVRVHARQPGRTRARADRLRAAEHAPVRARRGPPPGRSRGSPASCASAARGCPRLPAPSRSSPRRSSCRSRRWTVSRPGRCTAPETWYEQLPSGALETARTAGPADQAPRLPDRAGGDRAGRGRHRSGGLPPSWRRSGKARPRSLVGFVLPAESRSVATGRTAHDVGSPSWLTACRRT